MKHYETLLNTIKHLNSMKHYETLLNKIKHD